MEERQIREADALRREQKQKEMDDELDRVIREHEDMDDDAATEVGSSTSMVVRSVRFSRQLLVRTFPSSPGIFDDSIESLSSSYTPRTPSFLTADRFPLNRFPLTMRCEVDEPTFAPPPPRARKALEGKMLPLAPQVTPATATAAPPFEGILDYGYRVSVEEQELVVYGLRRWLVWEEPGQPGYMLGGECLLDTLYEHPMERTNLASVGMALRRLQ